NYNKAFNWSDSFYGSKYRWEERFLGFFAWSTSKVSKLCWGYGEQPLRVVFVAFVVLSLFAVGFWRYQLPLTNAPADMSFWEYYTFSAATFVTASYGNLSAASRSARVFTTVESILGLLFFGFFVATLYRRVSKR